MFIDVNAEPPYERDGHFVIDLNEEPPDEQDNEIHHFQKDEVKVVEDDEVHQLQKSHSHILQEDEQVDVPEVEQNVDVSEMQRPNEGKIFSFYILSMTFVTCHYIWSYVIDLCLQNDR
jgi:hypothetical protein